MCNTRITPEIGGSLGAVPWLLPSETASEILSWEGSWEETISWIWLDISLPRNSLHLYGMFLRRFLRRKHILDIVSQKQISRDFEYSLCCCKMKKTLGKFQLEAPRASSVSRFLAYVTLPHEWRISVEKGKKASEEKIYPAHTWVSWWTIINWIKHKCYGGEGDNWVKITFMTVYVWLLQKGITLQMFVCSDCVPCWTLIVPFVWTVDMVQGSW